MKRTKAIPLALALLASCDPGGSMNGPGQSDAAPGGADGGSTTTQGPSIGFDSQGCLNLVDHRTTTPLAPRGRLVVTYYDETLEATLCEWDDESAEYWCPEPSAIAAGCEAFEGVYWCPNASPPASRIGDPQEMGLLDLAHPELGVKRWTNNVVHEAEMDVSPDGARVVYAVRDYLDAFDNGKGQGIWVVNMDGSSPTRLTQGSNYAGIPAWIDNNRFTFVADDGVSATASNSGMYLFDLTTMKVTPFNITGAAVYPADPDPSHDGKQVVFKADVNDQNAWDIYVMQIDGSGVRQLTSGYSDHDPVFSLDDKKVYFERYYGPGAWDQYADLDRSEHPEINQWGIVEVDVASGAERVIIPHDPCGRHFFWLPTVSPDGTQLMFIHDYVDASGGGYQDLWVSDVSGGNAQSVPGTRELYWFDWTR